VVDVSQKTPNELIENPQLPNCRVPQTVRSRWLGVLNKGVGGFQPGASADSYLSGNTISG
jgi:hypothetical protein